jgi:hypothetical protein
MERTQQFGNRAHASPDPWGCDARLYIRLSGAEWLRGDGSPVEAYRLLPPERGGKLEDPDALPRRVATSR